MSLLIPSSLKSLDVTTKLSTIGWRCLAIALAMFSLIWFGGRVEAGCGSYVTVGNWQHGAKQLGMRQFDVAGSTDWRVGFHGARVARWLLPSSRSMNHVPSSDLPGECHGPNCSRQSPPVKVPITTLQWHTLPESLPFVVVGWAPDDSCCGWLTVTAECPTQWTSSILRPPRS